ncbi:uncharacterized protein N7483_002881 [Penicillium malachiteum]|uniref:uncharacterized protein n=1 Tax=Penicillium malachiteum TaxID=1324776 RepID=UPI00254750F6|nr:uncharacterized protein N7483_002881 [Penicillium malachiteum]KAJ5737756.1 hypothetical protein N7483_002881 [Penicillium malachiteum]
MQSKILKLGMRSNAATATQSADLLERAAIENKPEVIVELVEKGTDVNKRLANDWTALHIGSAHNYSNLVGRLLEQNADPELSLPDGSTALHISALNGHHQVVEVLLNHGAKPDTKREHDGLTPLHLAAAKSRKQALQLLLEAQEKYGMDIDQPAKNGATVLECACQSSSLECIEMIVSAGADVDAIVDLQGRTPLMITATTDNYQVAEILLNAGAEIDHVHEHNGIPAVTVAVFSGSLKVLETLISRGANLDLMGKNGYAPLRAAITGSNSEAAMMLLRSRVKVNTQYDDHQVTALHLAASRSLYNVVGSIIKMGADLKALDKDGDPPLQWAVHRGDPKMCEILLSHGAEVNRKNEKTGEVVLHWAVRAGHIMVTEFLLANGANALFVDLTQIKKSEDADEEDFEICKALLETAPDTSDQPDGKRPGSPTLPNPEVKGSDNLLQGENVNVKTPIGDSTEVVPSADQKDLPPQIESSKISNSFPKNDDESTVEPSLDASSRSELQFLLPNGTTLKSSVEKSKSEARQHLRILESDIRFSIYRARRKQQKVSSSSWGTHCITLVSLVTALFAQIRRSTSKEFALNVHTAKTQTFVSPV